MSQLKIGLNSVGKIYLVCGISKIVKTYGYGNKAADMFETIPVTVIFCYCSKMKI